MRRRDDGEVAGSGIGREERRKSCRRSARVLVCREARRARRPARGEMNSMMDGMGRRQRDG